MNPSLWMLLMCCVALRLSRTNATEHRSGEIQNNKDVLKNNNEETTTLSYNEEFLEQDLQSQLRNDVRKTADFENESVEQQEVFEKQMKKPLKNIFLGIYKNYKSTYLGNTTASDYRKKLREHIGKVSFFDNLTPDVRELENLTMEVDGVENNTQRRLLDESSENMLNDSYALAEGENRNVAKVNAKKIKLRKRKISNKLNKKRAHKIRKDSTKSTYNIGPGVNMCLDTENNIISVKLNSNNLKDIMNGQWLGDNSEQGRGKKYDMVTKVLPLFILPFLIQSAIVPFLVTKLKLLLMKSILVGKLAIFLLVISAFRNSNKPMQTYEVSPSYWAGEPSRRSELTAAASSAAYNGYRVEGKPAAWIN